MGFGIVMYVPIMIKLWVFDLVVFIVLRLIFVRYNIFNLEKQDILLIYLFIWFGLVCLVWFYLFFGFSHFKTNNLGL